MNKNTQRKQTGDIASDLIYRMERETGQRVDAGDGYNLAVAGLFGAMARELGASQHRQRDDVAAGILVRRQISPQEKGDEQSKAILASLLSSGMSPDEIKKLFGQQHDLRCCLFGNNVYNSF